MENNFLKYILRNRFNRILSILISFSFIMFYAIFTGMVSFLPYKLIDQPIYVFITSSNVNWNTVINIIFDGKVLLTLTPIAILLLLLNAILLSFNVIAVISLRKLPKCCNVKRTTTTTFTASLLASLGLFASCRGGGLLLSLLLATGAWQLIIILFNYGYLFQIIASLLLISNLIYLYIRYKNTIRNLNLYNV